MSAYIQSLLFCQRTEEIAYETCRKELDEKESPIRTLQETIKRNNESISSYEQEVRFLTIENNRIKKELATIQAERKTSSDVSLKLSELQKQLEGIALVTAERHTEKRGRKPRTTEAE